MLSHKITFSSHISSKVHFIYLAPNHNLHCLSGLYNQYCVQHPLSLDPDSRWEELPQTRFIFYLTDYMACDNTPFLIMRFSFTNTVQFSLRCCMSDSLASPAGGDVWTQAYLGKVCSSIDKRSTDYVTSFAKVVFSCNGNLC